MSTARPRLGIHYCPTDTSVDVVELALEAERLGFASLVLPEHTHIPVDSVFPGGGAVPERYHSVLDPYTALAFVAARSSLEIGTGISVVAQHDPIALAKRAATLDHLSGGRFTLGVGFGWNRPEFEAHGREFRRRRAITRAHVGLLRAAWAQEIAEFSDPDATLRPSWIGPKPYRRPAVPVLLGAPASARTFADIVDWADGWMPVSPSAEALAAGVGELRDAWAAAGREGAPRVHVVHLGASGPSLAEAVRGYADLGVDAVLLDVPTAPAGEALAVLREHARRIAE